MLPGFVAQSGLDPKVSKFEDSIVVRANVTASSEHARSDYRVQHDGVHSWRRAAENADLIEV